MGSKSWLFRIQTIAIDADTSESLNVNSAFQQKDQKEPKQGPYNISL